MKRTSHVVWNGNGKDGNGTLSTQSGALKDLPYSFKTRFQNDDGKLGTNPEELIAAAHAGCFNMKLSFVLNENDFYPDELTTDAELFTTDRISPALITTGTLGVVLLKFESDELNTDTPFNSILALPPKLYADVIYKCLPSGTI